VGLWYVATSRIVCDAVVAGEVVEASCYTITDFMIRCHGPCIPLRDSASSQYPPTSEISMVHAAKMASPGAIQSLLRRSSRCP
jgi:hypothetical protein